MADSRFATSIICVLILFRILLPLHILRLAAFIMPLLVICACFFIYSSEYQGPTDDLKGRLGLTGYFLSNFHLSEFFGAYDTYYTGFVDSGYPYIFHFNGLILALILWISLAAMKMDSVEGDRLKSFVMVFMATQLAIGGDAVYALKISGLMWFMVGARVLSPVVRLTKMSPDSSPNRDSTATYENQNSAMRI